MAWIFTQPWPPDQARQESKCFTALTIQIAGRQRGAAGPGASPEKKLLFARAAQSRTAGAHREAPGTIQSAASIQSYGNPKPTLNVTAPLPRTPPHGRRENRGPHFASTPPRARVRRTWDAWTTGASPWRIGSFQPIGRCRTEHDRGAARRREPQAEHASSSQGRNGTIQNAPVTTFDTTAGFAVALSRRKCLERWCPGGDSNPKPID